MQLRDQPFAKWLTPNGPRGEVENNRHRLTCFALGVYQVFRADKTVNPTADLNACFGCHKPQDKQDFVFTYDKLKVAAK